MTNPWGMGGGVYFYIIRHPVHNAYSMFHLFLYLWIQVINFSSAWPIMGGFRFATTVLGKGTTINQNG